MVSLLGKYRLLASSSLSRRGRVGMAGAKRPQMTRNCYSVKVRRKLSGERESRRKCKSRLCQSMQGSHAHSPSTRRNLRSPLAENLRRTRRRRWRGERLRKPGVDWKPLFLSQSSHHRDRASASRCVVKCGYHADNLNNCVTGLLAWFQVFASANQLG